MSAAAVWPQAKGDNGVGRNMIKHPRVRKQCTDQSWACAGLSIKLDGRQNSLLTKQMTKLQQTYPKQPKYVITTYKHEKLSLLLRSNSF